MKLRPQSRAISGIVAALILFVMLFTVGTGYFLWVNDNNLVYSQALVNRNNYDQARLNENVELFLTVQRPAGGWTQSGGNLVVNATNVGTSPVNLTQVLVTDQTGDVISSAAITGGRTINPGDSSGEISTGLAYWNAHMNQPLSVKVVSQRGNVYNAAYSPPVLTTALSATNVAKGTMVYDTASISGGYEPSGTVSFVYFASSTCTGTNTTSGPSVSVTSNGLVPASAPVTFDTLGAYGWMATYSGDSNNPPATSSCEPLSVEATTTLGTSLAKSSIPLGGDVTDTVTLYGATSKAGGTITFWWSLVNSCPTSGATLFSTVNVVPGVTTYQSVPTSQLSTEGIYYVYAVYTGDANDLGAVSPCEPLTVGLAVTTTLSASTVTSGASVTDSAVLHFSDPDYTPTGSVSYYYFSDSGCAGSYTLASTVTLSSGTVPKSSPVTFTVTGSDALSFSWDAVYSGDSHNSGPVTSPCEPLTVLPVAGTSGGTLGLVSESFRFYYTNCNPEDNTGTCPPGTGDGVNVGGYYGYGLSFNPLPTVSCALSFLGFCIVEGVPTAQPDVFQIQVTNTDPSRSITLSAQSFMLIQGQCEVSFFCSVLSSGFSQSYWIVDPAPSNPSGPLTGSSGHGASPSPYTAPVVIPPGVQATLYFYCTGGPCTSLSAPSSQAAPLAGESLTVSLGLFGIYSDGTPFAQTIPYVASYVSPVYISGVSNQVAGSLWLTGGIGSTIQITAVNFPTQPANVNVFWTNLNGTVSPVTVGTPSCSPSGSTYTCNVSFKVPHSATAGQFYGIYVTSDGVNNAYATVGVSGASTTTVSCSPGTVKVGGTSTCTATVNGQSPTGSVTWSQSPSGIVTFSGATCALVSGSCSVTATGKTVGATTINATYSGDINNQGSSGSASISVVSLAIAPSSGPANTVVTLSGAGYSPSTTYGYCISTSATSVSCLSGTSFTFPSSPTGTIPSGVTVTVPQGTAPGSYPVVVYQGTSVISSATFTVTTATLTVNPTSGPAGTTIALTGSGYAPSTSYTDCLSTSSVSASCVSGSSSSFTSGAGGTIPSGTNVVVPIATSTGSYFVVVYQASGLISSAAFSVTTATLTVNPTSGPTGTVTTLSGSGYAPSTSYSKCLSTSQVSTAGCIASSVGSFTTTAGGAIPAATTVTVPTGTSAGSYYVIVYQSTTVVSSAGFTVTSPSLTLSPVQGPPTTKTTLSGTGYALSSLYSDCLSTSAATVSCVSGSSSSFTTTAGGAIPAATTVTVPSGTSAGGYFAIVYLGSNVVQSALFTVTSPAITLAPGQGPQGVSVTVTGSGFSVSTGIGSITIAGGTISTQTCTSQTTSAAGAFTCRFTAPSVSSGGHLVTVSGSDIGSVGGDTASATYTLTVPAITLTPSQGPAGVSVNVQGTGFSVQLAIGSITFNGATPSSQTCTSQTTSATGAFACSFTVPSIGAAGYAVVVSGSDLGTVPADTASATFTITTPSIVLSPNSGSVGVSVTVTGSGYSVNTALGSITIAGGTISTQTCTSQTTSATGSFSCAFTLPGDTAGSHTVTVSGSDVGSVPADRATASFSVTPSISLSPSSGPVGTTITVTGTGFAGSSTITIRFNGATQTTSPTTVTTSATGGFTATFSAPSLSTGAYTVSATDASANTASATFTITVNKHIASFTTTCSGSTCQVTLGAGTVTSGDVLVATVGTSRSSTTCTSVSSVSDSLSGAWSSSPGTVAASNSAAGQCAYDYINYKTAGAGGADTITVTLSSSSYNSAVLVVYDLTGYVAPPSGGFAVGSCNTSSGCGNPASMSTSSLSYSANSFLIASGSTCYSVGGGSRSITQGVNGFTTTYDTGLNLQEYVGYEVPTTSGSTPFGMQADSGSSSVACWTDIGAQFLDPPTAPSGVALSLPGSPVASDQGWMVGSAALGVGVALAALQSAVTSVSSPRLAVMMNTKSIGGRISP